MAAGSRLEVLLRRALFWHCHMYNLESVTRKSAQLSLAHSSRNKQLQKGGNLQDPTFCFRQRIADRQGSIGDAWRPKGSSLRGGP